MAYKIKWKDGGTTAEAYSSKALAEKILKEIKHEGKVIKFSLASPPRSPLSGRKTVWVRSKPFSGVKGFVYHTRAISALSKAEKKRVVKTGMKITLTRRKSINKNQGKHKRQLARVIVYDDGGKTIDRYTIITPDNSVYGMSSDPFSPQGFCQYVGEKNEFPHGLSHTGKRIDATKLPEIIQKAILQRMKM